MGDSIFSRKTGKAVDSIVIQKAKVANKEHNVIESYAWRKDTRGWNSGRRKKADSEKCSPSHNKSPLICAFILLNYGKSRSVTGSCGLFPLDNFSCR